MAIAKLYTINEAAEILSVTQRTAYSYTRKGLIKAVKVGGQWRITEEALKEFIEHGASSDQEAETSDTDAQNA